MRAHDHAIDGLLDAPYRNFFILPSGRTVDLSMNWLGHRWTNFRAMRWRNVALPRACAARFSPDWPQCRERSRSQNAR
jgi:hypothetical protein